MFNLKILRSPWTAAGWFVMMSVLFFLPGSALPEENMFAAYHLDKWVHAGLFAGQLFLLRSSTRNRTVIVAIGFLLISVLYGWLVEIIQRDYIPHRDFDLYDVLWDTIGAIAGLCFSWWVYKKNKPL